MSGKTKYILHGGNIRDMPEGGKIFFEEIVEGLGKKPKVLLCFFALPKQDWEGRYKEWKARIEEALGATEPVLEMAKEDTYEQQASRNDALFIYGGDSELLLDLARKTEGFIPSLAKFKSVAGSSAGAILLADTSWGCDRRAVTKGLGIVPANTLVHYRSSYGSDSPLGPIDWGKAEAELRAVVGPKAKISKLGEGKWEVFVLIR